MAAYKPIDYVIAIVILAFILQSLRVFLFRKIRFDGDFIKTLAPPMLFAIFLRLLVDAGVVEKSKLWSVTPGVYIVGIVYGLILVHIGIAVQERTGIAYWKTSLALGFLGAFIPLSILIKHMISPLNFFKPVLLATLATALVYGISLLSPRLDFLRVRYSYLVLFAHFLDASGTFIGIDFYGFGEEHIVAEYFINLTGTALVMFPLKLAVVGTALYLLEKWYEEEREELYYKIIKVTMFVLGVGPGMRNALLLTLV